MNYDCWFVHYGDGAIAAARIDKNAHEVLFIANAKTGAGYGRITKIVSIFKNEWCGNRHRHSHQGMKERSQNYDKQREGVGRGGASCN